MEDELLTSAEVARLLRVHPKHLYRLLRRGLPGHRLGRGHWRFARAEVLAWMGSRTRLPPQGSAELDAQLVAPATAASRPQGRRVVLGRVGERWVAHPVDARAHRSADGIADGLAADATARPSRTRVGLLRPLAEMDSNVLVAGCAPVLGLLLDRAGEGGPGRAHWVPCNSRAALDMLGRGHVHVAGIHLEGATAHDDHATLARAVAGPDARLFRMVRWRTGLALSAAHAQLDLEGLLEPSVRWVVREAGAGVSAVLERALRSVGAGLLDPDRRSIVTLASDHDAVAQTVRMGLADVGPCIEPVARAHGLRFLPLQEERFDLVVTADSLAHPHVGRLLRQLDDAVLRREVGALGAYDASALGQAATP
ncbi:MAG: helix-turn-helix transcriptional regulator [Nannocystaceae bacterium]